MKQVIEYGAIIISIASLHAVLAADKQSVKIVNSTNVREMKLTLPKEDKTGAVAYVYAVESTELNSTSESSTTTTTESNPKRSRHDGQTPSVSDKSTNKRKCVTRVIEKMKGDERTVYYNATANEAKEAGKNVVDTVCEGDVGFELVSKVSLANLEDDIYLRP